MFSQTEVGYNGGMSLSLHSPRPKVLVRFLSELLDLEVHPPLGEKEEFLLKGEQFCFQVGKSESSSQIPTEFSTPLNFEFSKLSELENLSRKVEFMEYRRTDKNLESSFPPLKFQKGRLGHRYFMWICDPDGRSWQFFYKEEC